MRLGIICCYQHCSLLGNAFPFIDFLKGLQYVVAFALIMNDMESCKERALLITNERGKQHLFLPELFLHFPPSEPNGESLAYATSLAFA